MGFQSVKDACGTATSISVLLKGCRSYYIDGKALPDYRSMVQRRLHGLRVSVGDVATWNIGGRDIQCTIRSISGDPIDCKIDQLVTEIEICKEPFNEACVESIYTTGLVDTIYHSFTNSDAYRTLGIDTVKSILVHGVSGVGKTTLVRHAAKSLLCELYEVSVYDLLLFSEEEFSTVEFRNYNPLSLIMNKASHSSPSIVLLRDLNALAKDEKSRIVIDILGKEINKIKNSVCIIGLARQLSSLPDSFKRTDIFKQHVAIAIPTMLERVDIIKSMLKEEGIDALECEEYASQIGLRTSGYVAKDLKRLIKEAKLKSKRRFAKQDMVEQLVNLSLSSHISWQDIDYALEMYRPSQQVELGSGVPKRDWKEWGGYKAVKDKVRQSLLLPIQQPQVFQKLGIKPPSGLLLYGPSGSGKTALVQALITESKMNVIAIQGPEIFSKYLGETEEKIRKLFASAKRMAPCIVFVDEMDAIGSKRGVDLSGGVNERVLSTLLNEMDGVEGRQGVVVIGCTNRPDQIDDAILRPGRLDQLIYIGLPTEQDRVDIIQTYVSKMSVAKDVNPQELGKQTEFCTGADIENLFREAGSLALRKNMEAQYITKEDFDEVIVSICERAEDLVLQGKLDLYERFLHDHHLK